MAAKNTIIDTYTAPVGTAGADGPMNSIPAAKPASPFSSSAQPIIDKQTETATQTAKTSMNTAPPPPVKTFATNSNVPGAPSNLDYDNLPTGFTKTPPPNGQSYSLISTPYGPVYQALGTAPAAPGSATPTLPQGYTAAQPDSQGNITYTNSTTGHTFTIPAGTANPGQVASNVSTVQAQVTTSLGQGYNTAPDANGNISVTDPTGKTLGTISPEVASSPASLAEAMGNFTTHSSTLTAASAAMDASNAQNDSDYQEQTQQLQQERDAAVASELAGSGGGLGSNAGAISAVKTRYDQLQQDLDAKYQAQKLAISSANTTAIANADSNLSSALASITENAKQTVIGQTQQSFTNAQSLVTKINLPVNTIQGLSLNSNNSTGNSAADAAIQAYIAGGLTPAQALATVQSGSIAQNKANQTDWLNLIKGFPITNDISGMSLADAQKDPFYSQLISQGANVMGTPDAAWSAIQNGSAAALAAAKIQSEIAFEAADTNRMLAEAQAGTVDATAATKWVSVSNALTKNMTSSATYKAIAGASDSLANLESAMNDPGSVSDTVLVQSLAKLSIGGSVSRISTSQLSSIIGGQSISDWATKIGNQISGQGGQLSPDQRKQALALAQALYTNYQTAYKTQIYDPSVKQLNAAGVPPQYQTLPDPTSMSLSSLGATNAPTPTGTATNANGVLLTQYSDGSITDAQGNKYDANGDLISQ